MRGVVEYKEKTVFYHLPPYIYKGAWLHTCKKARFIIFFSEKVQH